LLLDLLGVNHGTARRLAADLLEAQERDTIEFGGLYIERVYRHIT
jgi:hypothetical protein